MADSLEIRPTQDQLRQLRDTVLGHEPTAPPFDGIPADVSLTRFIDLAAPPLFDEKLAPSAVLRGPDKRAVWLSVFRDPDTNRMLKQSILLVDPPINRSERPEIPQVSYELLEDLGRLAVRRIAAPPVTSEEVTALQELIDLSEDFDF
ncbi:MAG TPA: hypothetical protein VK694_00305 [Verrucomicrobiae bacterium]|nr:hypothetical protein [Verrucomicrobiae bacterium]